MWAIVNVSGSERQAAIPFRPPISELTAAFICPLEHLRIDWTALFVHSVAPPRSFFHIASCTARTAESYDSAPLRSSLPMPFPMKRLRATVWFTWSRWRSSTSFSSALAASHARTTRYSSIIIAVLLLALLTLLTLGPLNAPFISRTAAYGVESSSPVHLLVADVQLEALKANTVLTPDRRLGRAIRDIASQTERRLVIHFIVDEATFLRWQADDKHSFAANTDEVDRDSLDAAAVPPASSYEQHRGWRAAVRAFHRQSAAFRESLIALLPWFPQHLQHVVILPYSFTRILAMPWPDSPLTVGDRLKVLCADMALTDCDITPTGVYLVKTMLAAVLPQWADHVIVLDSDVRVYGDIGDMLEYLRRMRSQLNAVTSSSTTASLPHSFLSSLFAARPRHPVMALAAEQQTFYDLRHPTTMRGRLGFNGGVQLQDLIELRRTEPGSAGREYNDRVINSSLSRQFTMGLLLGDQTVYTALNNSAPDLFFSLPCQWNRQLCEYYYEPWRERDVEARRCPGQWRIVHGNCAQERDTPEELGDQWRDFHKQNSQQAAVDVDS